MKKIPFALLFSALLFGACSGGRGRLTVAIQGMTDDSLICSYITPATIRERGDQTTLLVGGDKRGDKTEFSIDLPDNDRLYRVFLAPQSFAGDGPNQHIELFLLPGERVHVEAAYEPKSKAIDYTLTGSDDQQRWREAAAQFEPLRLRLEMLGMAAMMISPDRRSANDSIYKQIQNLADSIQRIKAAYVGAHPADPVSGFYLIDMPDSRGFDSLYRLLDESVRQGPLGEWLDWQKETNDNLLAAERARQTVVAGNAAPDFTLPDAGGEPFTLSSLYGKGKYVVLDFWGTWCVWCMKGIPAMKEAYGKHDGAVEFVGIDCGDKEETWRRTVEEQALPWINVRAEGDDIPARFGVEGFPTKLIIDPQGIVVVRFTGEDPAFYTTLDSLTARR